MAIDNADVIDATAYEGKKLILQLYISKMLGLHPNKVYELIKEGVLPKIPCCRHIKVAKISVIKYVLQSAQ